MQEIRPDEDDLPEAESDNEEADVTMADGETSIEPEASTSKFVPKPKKSSNSDSDSSSDSDDSDDENAEVDEDFRNELLAALTAGGVSEAFENAENGEDAEEELLNDDQMMAMDEKLADIFRLQSGGKKGKKAQRTVGIKRQKETGKEWQGQWRQQGRVSWEMREESKM